VKFLRRKGIDPETRETFQPRLWLIVAGLAAIVAYLVAFVAENNKSVKVHFVFYTGETSVIWLVLLSLAIGLVAGLLLSQLERRRGRHKSG
jgi:LPXTG-motif cell wall-anchored protein